MRRSMIIAAASVAVLTARCNRASSHDPSLGSGSATLLPNGLNPINYALVVAGYILVPPSSNGFATQKTFAIGSNDGAYFAIQGCAPPASASADCSGTQIYTVDDTASTHAMQYKTT